MKTFLKNIDSGLLREAIDIKVCVCVYVCMGRLPHTLGPEGTTRPYLIRIKQRI